MHLLGADDEEQGAAVKVWTLFVVGVGVSSSSGSSLASASLTSAVLDMAACSRVAAMPPKMNMQLMMAVGVHCGILLGAG